MHCLTLSNNKNMRMGRSSLCQRNRQRRHTFCYTAGYMVGAAF
jgi:hypothetical protein